jgi:hypothetical protein
VAKTFERVNCIALEVERFHVEQSSCHGVKKRLAVSSNNERRLCSDAEIKGKATNESIVRSSDCDMDSYFGTIHPCRNWRPPFDSVADI